ncbi:MAG TPA: condensation domain-containing protein, partial [Thermomicrobiales bacterium]|nr:condensation domain-containing protein [Thermomicrobiales bacterium]
MAAVGPRALATPAPEAVAPLLPAQRRIWLLQRLFPNGTAHAVPIVIRLDGRLDVAALQRALDALAARHPALRTTFAEHNGTPVQLVWPECGVRLERPRLRQKRTGHDEVGAQAALRILLDAAIRAPFDLAEGPLLRAQLIKRAPRSHVLALIVHGIVCDDDSRRTLGRELVLLYRAFTSGRPDSLPPPPVTPQAIAAARAAEAGNGARAADLAWWRATLAGVETLQLLPDRAAPPLPSQRAERHPADLPPDLVAPLLALAAAEDATPLAVVLAL